MSGEFGESVKKESVKATTKQFENQKGKLIGIGAVGVIVILALIFLFTGSKKISVDINEYITVSFSGYDSCGYADVDIDKNAIQDILVEEGIDSSESEYPELDQDDIARKVAVSIDADIDLADQTLSNGDVITVTITYNEELAEGCNVEFKVKEESFTVSGLEPLVSLNPFDDLTVKFTGASPYALPSIDLNTTNEFLKTKYYSFSSESYQAGDVVTVTFEGTEEDANRYGYTVDTYTCDYVCEDVNMWIESDEPLSDANIETLKAVAMEGIDKYLNKLDAATMTSYEYQGMYVMSQGFDTSSLSNQVVIVYKAGIHYESVLLNYDDEIYFPVCIESIITTPDGEVLYDSDTEILTGYQTGLPVVLTYLYGYADGFEMYDAIITQNASQYNYVVTDSLVQFGE